MRFRVKSKPKGGDTRTVKKFAWLPCKVGNHVIWLEPYASCQSYVYAGYDSYWNEDKRRLLSKQD